MTGIAAVLGPKTPVTASKLGIMLDAMEARGSIKHSTTIETKTTSISIGSCSHPAEESVENLVERTDFVADGLLPSSLRLEETEGIDGHHSIAEAIRESKPFSCLAVSEGRLLSARDALGQKPLYYGRDSRGVVAFASLKAALSEIGISHPTPVGPGRLVEITWQKQRVVHDETLNRPKQVDVPEKEATKRIGDLLLESLSEETVEPAALAFSGGLDSTLVAQAAKENGLSPELVTVGMKGQAELDHARRVAKTLGLDLTLRELSVEDVVESLDDVVRTVESVDPVIVGVSVPLFLVCRIAQKMGMKRLLAGQLSDELFGGYGRFDSLASTDKHKDAADEIWRSVIAASTNDFEPGDKMAVSHGLELRCPFGYRPLVEYALRLPVSLKLRSVKGTVVRKYILRRLASSWKLPASVVDRPKKAVQYSSGVQKVLLKEAKKRGMSLGDWLKSLA